MVQVHEGFEDGDVIFLGGLGHLIEAVERNGRRLFAEDVLAGFGGAHGPLGVHGVGQRVVDDVDVGVGEQRFVAAEGFGNALLGGVCLSGFFAAAGDGDWGRWRPKWSRSSLD